MLQILKNGLRKKVAILLIFCLTFCTNSFSTLSTVYADDNEAKIENQVEAPGEEGEAKEKGEKPSEEKASEEKTEEGSSEGKTSEEKSSEEKTLEEKTSDDTSEKVSTKSEAKEDEEEASKDEEPEDDVLIATESEPEIIIDEVEDKATESNTKYMELDAYNQFMYQDEDSVSYYDGTIILLKDLKLKDAIYFKDDATLDLSGHKLTGPEDNYALYVEDNFTLTNSGDIVGKIEGDNNEFPTIYIKSATAEFAGGEIYGASGKEGEKVEDKIDPSFGGDALHVYDSDIVVSGALIYGGTGLKSYNDRGGNGGDALVVMSSLTSNTILISEGGIKGGKGGDGYGDEKPGFGSAIKVGKAVYTGQYLGRGLKGNIGGGTGGTAINIKTDKFKSENLTYERYTVSAGDSGYSTSISKNEEMIKDHMLFASGNGGVEESEMEVARNDLFGTGWTDPYYSLHDLNGQNYLTSLKYQNPTGLCTAFAMTAYAETNLIKKYPDYVRNVLNKNVDDTLDLSKWHTTTSPHSGSSTDNANELNLSEMQFGMQLFAQPRDEFGNAGLSKHISKTSSGGVDNDWEDYGSNSFELALASTSWRSLVEEDAGLRWPEWGDQSGAEWDTSASKTLISYAPGDANYMNVLNSRTNNTVVHAKEALVRDAGDFYNGSTFKRDEFIEQAKKDILKYNGFEFFIYTCGKQQQATFPGGSHQYIKNGVDYGNVTSLDAPSSYSGDLGGHAIYCIGWDDGVEFDGAYGHYTGAFICKNSWHQFTLVPYDNAWGVTKAGSVYYMDYMVVDFVPSFSEYENIYFYDSGAGGHYYPIDPGEVALNTFKINNDKEKIKAISFYMDKAGTFDVSLYKVSSLDNVTTLKNDLNNASNKKFTATVDASKGYNIVKVTDDSINCNKDEIYAVLIEGGPYNLFVDSAYENGDEKYEAVAKHRSFYAGKSGSSFTYLYKFDSGSNARIRLITNNRIVLHGNSDSGSGSYGILDIAYVDPILRATLSYLPEPTPVAGKVFRDYNTKSDGTGTTYTTNSFYHQDIAAGTLILYAQYNDSTNNKTLTFDKNDSDATGTMPAWTRAAGTSIIVPTATFEKVGYRFDHWTLNNTTTEIGVGDSLTLNDDTTLKAVWVPKNYHIDYELYGATFTTPGVDTISYVDELDVPATASMTYVGHEFKGWYDNEAFSGSPVRKMRVDRTNPQDLTYHAKWDIQKFTISFNMHGHGTSIADQSVDYGSRINEPDTPTESGYAFMGWFTDDTYATKWNFNTAVYADRTLHASWSEAVNVVFDTTHGRAPANQYIVEGGTITDPGAISVIGYDFIHWYENDEETPFDFSTIIRRVDGATRTLHAKWEVKTYNVTLNTNGGTISSGNITSYTYGVGATLPTSVVAPNSNQYFAGWYASADFKGNVVRTISVTDYGDKTYFAKYEKQSSGGDSPSRGGSSTTGGANTAGNVMSPAFTEMKYGPNANPTNDTTVNVSLKTIPVTMDTFGSTWETDANGKTHLVIKNSKGLEVDAKNVFACVVTKAIDKDGKSIDIQDFYYLDNNGNVYTGWLRDTNNLNYYFTEEAGYNQGKLARGWTKIKGDYYYFDGNGNLQKNMITPDGFVVDGNGKWLENAWQDGFINVSVQKEITDDYNVITSKDNVIIDGGADANIFTGGINQAGTNNGSAGTTKKQVGKKLNK